MLWGFSDHGLPYLKIFLYFLIFFLILFTFIISIPELKFSNLILIPKIKYNHFQELNLIINFQ